MPDHTIFISYSRRNTDFVHELQANLDAAGFGVWLDTADLTPGTPNWERAIRDAIKACEVVVYVASPDAFQSEYVQGELTVAQLYQRPIYPIWADGDQWIECVPLHMANYQYADGRAQQQPTGIAQLIATLRSVLDTSEGTITLGLPTHETIELNLAQFASVIDFLNFLYLNYLQTWYEPLTYGDDWVLGNVTNKRLGLPWQYFAIDRSTPKGMMKWMALASTLSLSDFGIKHGDYWAVWEAKRVRKAIVALRTESYYERILSPGGERELYYLYDEAYLSKQPPDEIMIELYPIVFVRALLQTSQTDVAYLEV